MPKAIMETLNLEITRPYKYLFSFDSSKVKCIGLIKDLCVNLVQYPGKSMVMDIVVADIRPKYGMLLSRSWGAKLQGYLQLDMSYATISVYGQPKKLYRETLMKFMVSSAESSINYPIYSAPTDLDSFILCNSDNNEIQTELINIKPKQNNDNIFHEALWHLDFDCSVNKTGAGARIWITNIETGHSEGHAFTLNFKCTNNMAKYEALILGLQIIRKLGGKGILIMGDSEFIIKQVNGDYYVHNPRLARYRDASIDLADDLMETKLLAFPEIKMCKHIV